SGLGAGARLALHAGAGRRRAAHDRDAPLEHARAGCPAAPRRGVILRVGLTGGLGAGKSTVARRLAERGLPVLDADRVVHALYEPGGKGSAAIAAAFGPELLDARGAVDRPRLAARVFGD